MNKIAAYQIALAEIEQEKRASALVEAYGTMDGYMPEGYLQAFDEIEKEAMLKATGGFIANRMKGLGKMLSESGEAAARSTPMTGPVAKVPGARRSGAGKLLEDAGASLAGNEDMQKLVGAGALAAGGLAAGGMGASFLAGRATAPRQQR